MNITPNKVIKSVDVADYAKGFTGTLDIWVNPPLETLSTLSATLSSIGEKGLTSLAPIMSILLSQGKPENAVTVEEFAQVIEDTKETDPAFLSWVLDVVIGAIHDHRALVKKS